MSSSPLQSSPGLLRFGGALGVCLIVACFAFAGVAEAAARPVDPQAIQALRDLHGFTRANLHVSTGAVRFIAFEKGGPPQFAARGGRSARSAAAAFLAAHKAAFGLTDPATELSLERITRDPYRHQHVRYRQRHRGLDVFGGQLDFHFDAKGDLTSVSGVVIPEIAVSAIPDIPRSRAEAIAVHLVGKSSTGRPGRSSLSAFGAELMFFRAGLVQGLAGETHLVYAVDVADADRTLWQIVFVDAHSGAVVENYDRIEQALSRRVSEASLANVVWTEGNPDPIPAGWAGGTAQQLTDWQNEIDGAAEIHHLIANLTAGAWLSYDGGDTQMRTVNNDPGIICPNATWNGVTTNYCSNVTADDVVAHEWGHAYTDFSHGLVYAWQPGALNESYSDIWGEIVDLVNGRGSDAPGGFRSDGSCSTLGAGAPAADTSYRWLVGEDASAFGGAIRDLWRPNCYGDPGKVSDVQYACSSADGGGVHSNSGVPNHAFALIVDGGSYNGHAITGIGLTKAAHVYWYAQTQFQTPTSGFEEHADALEASCGALIGAPLNALDTDSFAPSASGEVIDAGDCSELAEAVAAVEFRAPPSQCGFEPMLQSPAPILCEGLGTLSPFGGNDWESGMGGWTAGSRSVANPASFAAVGNWQIASSLPDGRPGSAAFGPDPVIGDCAADDVSGVLVLESPDMLVPANAAVPRFAFDHRLATEAGWDGGNVKVSVNGGPFQQLPSSRLTFNPYNGVLESAVAGNTNPMQNEPAFSGTDGGSVSGSWGQSQVNLYGMAFPGDTIRLRFELGMDGCNGLEGWYVDDVQAYYCADEQAPICGDGVVDVGETCDDGNPDDGDGCSSECLVESGFACADPFIGQVDAIVDGSFEAGRPSPYWTAVSVNFGEPLCTLDLCGGPGASDGDWYVWFGGIAAYEAASVEQSIVIPNGGNPATLSFDLLVGVCDSPADYMKVSVDGAEVFDTGPCTPNGIYQPIAVDLSVYADGNAHIVRFHSESFSTNGGWANFFLDRVQLRAGPELDLPSICAPVAPFIQVDPPAISRVVGLSGSATASLSVGNVGAGGLNWYLTEDDVPAGAAASIAVLQPNPGREVATSRRPIGSPAAGARLGAGRGAVSDPAALPRRFAEPAPPVAPLGAITLTQSASHAIQQYNSVTCWEGTSHVDSRYYRVFDLDAFEIGTPLAVSSVDIGIESASANSGSQPLTVNLYLLDGDFVLANLTPIGSHTISQPNATQVLANIPVAADVPAGSQLVVEIFTPDGSANSAILFVGSNGDGQTAPSYLQAPDCGIPEPVDLADLGFPSMHIVMQVHGVLASACEPASDVPWASASPGSGTLAAGASQTVDVAIDATGLAFGTYDATLCIDSNDRTNPRLEIPLTLVVSGDPDQDGVDSSVEDAGPNGGDGNGDGILDSAQSGVATLNIAGAYVTLASDNGCDATIDIASGSFGIPDPGFEHPQGVIGFTLTQCDAVPAAANVKILYHGLPNPAPEDVSEAVYRKTIPENQPEATQWFSFYGATFGTTDIDGAGPLAPVLSVVLKLRDGRLGDNPLSVLDGRITDPGALAYADPVTEPAPPTVTEIIPALSPWALPLLAVLLLPAARWVTRSVRWPAGRR